MKITKNAVKDTVKTIALASVVYGVLSAAQKALTEKPEEA